MFAPPFTTGMSASFTITGIGNYGGGLVFDLQGNLWVADSYNNCILGFPSSVLYSGTSISVSSATVVLGQPNFTSTTAGLGIQALKNPTGLAINPATGDLMCVDAGNNRIVGWYYLHKQTQSNALDSKYIFYNE
jgi:DNA-binding beta-propeller fold protein YncE